jgi:hypothetical protein
MSGGGVVLPSEFRSGKVAVLGMGGGCDILTAFTVAKLLPGLPRDAVYGNTKRTMDEWCRPMEGSDLGGYLFTTAPGCPCPLVAGANYYGTCGIDASVPQLTTEEPRELIGGHEPNATSASSGRVIAPLLLRIPKVPKLPGSRADEGELKAIAGALVAHGFTAFIGVDAGGDSITGGIDHNGDPSTGTDQMCHRVLLYTGLPYIQLVCGLGCDGESTDAQLRDTLERLAPRLLRSVDDSQTAPHLHRMTAEWVGMFERLNGPLGSSRTPALMAHAVRAVDASDGGWSRMVALGSADPSKVPRAVIDRGLQPEIGFDLLTSYVLVQWT